MSLILQGAVVPDNFKKKLIDFAKNDNSDQWRAFNCSINDKESQTKLNRGRKIYRLPDYPELYNEAVEFGRSVIDQQGLNHDMIAEITDGIPHTLNMLFHSPGALGIQKHTDPDDDDTGWKHMRWNFLLKEPAEGGEVVIENKIYNEFTEGKGMVLFSSKWFHRVLPVPENEERILLSLGYCVEPEYYRNVLLKRYTL